jgi:hypothetical protein
MRCPVAGKYLMMVLDQPALLDLREVLLAAVDNRIQQMATMIYQATHRDTTGRIWPIS